MKVIKLNSLITASLLVTCLTGCLGYEGSVSANDLNTTSLSNSYRDLSVTLDQNIGNTPQYAMFISLGYFGLGTNTIRDIQSVVVTNPNYNQTALTLSNIDFELLRWITFGIIPGIGPVSAYYANDVLYTPDLSSNEVSINYKYTVKENDTLPIVNASFNQGNIEITNLNDITCTDQKSAGISCQVQTSNPINNNPLGVKYSLVFNSVNNQDKYSCPTIPSINIGSQTANIFTVSAQPYSLANSIKGCIYNVNILSSIRFTQDHDRLEFSYVSKDLQTTIQ